MKRYRLLVEFDAVDDVEATDVAWLGALSSMKEDERFAATAAGFDLRLRQADLMREEVPHWLRVSTVKYESYVLGLPRSVRGE